MIFFWMMFQTVFAFGQYPIINLSFTGVDNWQHIDLNKIEIRNLDKSCDTTLFWPDTVLSLNTLGINNMYYSNEGLQIYQNTPNPVNERTSIKIYVPERGNVNIQISDFSGRVITSQQQELERGTHVFIFTPGNAQTYLFTAIYKKETRTIKIISGNRSLSNECSLVYKGTEGENTIKKFSYTSEKFLFSLGDSLEMTGYYSDFTSILIDNPTTSKTYTFTFSSTSPIVKTSFVTNITQTTATGGGNVTSEGGTVVTAKGVCWSASSNPTTDDNKTLDGGGIGEFVSFLTGLTANTTYFVRAYATNSTGTSYGLQKAFTTLTEVTIPSVITAAVSNITNVSAQSGGTVTNDGGTGVVARGVCWSTTNNPTILDAHTSDGTGTGGFVSQLTGLSPTTFYYVRAYATNSAGTAYGNQQTFSALENPILPIVTTAQVINITTTNATSGGNVASDGGVDVTARGVCWSTSPYPTIANSHTTDGNGTGPFISYLTELTTNTLYYVRAYAINSVGTAYGNQLSFTTLTTATFPTVTTDPATAITQTSATSGGNVTSDGGATVTVRGVCWNTISNPTINDNKTIDGSGTGTFTSYLTGLTPNTHYYVRAYATNSVGTAYGNEITFTTLPNPIIPTVTTTAVTDITQTTATSGGNVTSDGGATVTARGVCWSTSSNPTTSDNHTTDGSGTGTFVSYLTSLTPNTLYFVRAYGTNSVGTGYGNEVAFTTGQNSTSPVVATALITDITQTNATSGGTVTYDGGATVTARGVCWSTSSNPTIVDSYTNDGTGTGTFISYLTSLTPNTLYYVRAYAINSVGTAYGNEVSFTTLTWQCGDTIIYSGQTYNTILIGTQCWMKENLNIGTMIPGTQNQTDNGIIEKYCYNNDPANCTVYGGLYRWDEMMQNTTIPGAQGICKVGWHLPTDAEWTTLTDYLGGESVAGIKMKSISGWYNNGNGTNSSGFTALPGGIRSQDGLFYYITQRTYFWSSSEFDSQIAWHRQLQYNWTEILRSNGNKPLGFSVRCLKDWACGSIITINHVAGSVAPVNKTVTYGTVTNIPGETSKCWITSNLGADQQATAVNDATEPSAGWYWQFNRKQGYKHDGTTRTPNTTWITTINENFDWQSSNDPCTIELGSGWRIPTSSEWTNVDASGGWTNWDGPWNSALKLHASGMLDPSDGSLNGRGSNGQYFSSIQYTTNTCWALAFSNSTSELIGRNKANGQSIRCIKDNSSFTCGSSLTINHVAGSVSPVNKTVTYGTVTNIPGETSKCWITSNLGADHQATAVDDATEPSAGWYWQFNRQQGYKHDGTNITPSWTITSINENFDWQPANDPCSIELGSIWRIPTYTEWSNVNTSGGWTNWNGPWNSCLKLHSGGYIMPDDWLWDRGSQGHFYTSMQYNTQNAREFGFSSSTTYVGWCDKAYGFTLRCIKE